MMFTLYVNTTKTQIVFFFLEEIRRIPTFHYGCDVVEVISDYVYLGITINYNNKFGKAIRNQLDQGRKAQFYLLCSAVSFILSSRFFLYYAGSGVNRV